MDDEAHDALIANIEYEELCVDEAYDALKESNANDAVLEYDALIDLDAQDELKAKEADIAYDPLKEYEAERACKAWEAVVA